MPRLPTTPLPSAAYLRPWPAIPSKPVSISTSGGDLSVRVPVSSTKVTVKSTKFGVNIAINKREPKLILKPLDLALEKKRLKRNAAARRLRHKQMLLEQQKQEQEQQKKERDQDWEEEHRQQLEELEPVGKSESKSDPAKFGSHFLSGMFSSNEPEPPEDEPEEEEIQVKNIRWEFEYRTNTALCCDHSVDAANTLFYLHCMANFSE